MRRKITGKLQSGAGAMVRAALLLLIPIVILLALILYPRVQKLHYQSQQIACNLALDTARDQLTIDYLTSGELHTADHAREVVGEVMNRWQDLCPGGGTVYLVETERGEPPYTLICGLHDTDKKYCTRLNADYALTQLQNALEKANDGGDTAELTAVFNGKTFTARRVTEDPDVRRGTTTTDGEKGTVIYYAVMGESDFCADCGARSGEICYFAFADENYCAVWRPDKGWTGDSYYNI